jgi:FtsH-binding integral membrane protein
MGKFVSMGAGLVAVLALVPQYASAQTGFQNIFAALETVEGLISKLIPLVIGAAVLVFLWGILKFVIASSEEDKAKGRQFMIWGVIGLFVMVSVWGLVNFFRNTLGLTGGANTPPPPPGVPWR